MAKVEWEPWSVLSLCVTLANVTLPFQDFSPHARNAILSQLEILRESGLALHTEQVRAIMCAYIETKAPDLLRYQVKGGGYFSCSERYVREFLHSVGWSKRSGTKAAQKLDPNWRSECKKAHLRLVKHIAEHKTPPQLVANCDQTPIVIKMPNTTTWNKRGAKDVAIVDKEEKRAYTALLGATMSGAMLPVQQVWKGKTSGSLPSRNAKGYKEAEELGFKFVVASDSKKSSYFSTVLTMKQYFVDILAPHFFREMRRLGLNPAEQVAAVLLDVYAVHRSAEFTTWVTDTFPWIKIFYIPACCTSVWQPMDVGMNRLAKHSARRSSTADSYKEAMALLDEGLAPRDVVLTTSLPILRDRSVQTCVDIFHTLNKEHIVKKVV